MPRLTLLFFGRGQGYRKQQKRLSPGRLPAYSNRLQLRVHSPVEYAPTPSGSSCPLPVIRPHHLRRPRRSSNPRDERPCVHHQRLRHQDRRPVRVPHPHLLEDVLQPPRRWHQRSQRVHVKEGGFHRERQTLLPAPVRDFQPAQPPEVRVSATGADQLGVRLDYRPVQPVAVDSVDRPHRLEPSWPTLRRAAKTVPCRA